MSSSEIRIKLPLLPSERDKIHRQRLSGKGGGGTEEDTDADKAKESASDQGHAVEKNEVKSPGPISQDTKISDTPVEKLHGSSEQEERESRQERIRQYQETSFSSQPPLPVSTTSRVLQDVLLLTSQFVNAFAADADYRLEESSKEISALERQMGLLEIKLASVSSVSSPNADNEHAS